jgi:hypothetical protein
MFRPENFLSPRLFLPLVAALCLLALKPVSAADSMPETNAAPIASPLPAPGFLNRQPLGELRPADSDPGSTSSSSPDSDPLPSQTAASSPQLAADAPAPASDTPASAPAAPSEASAPSDISAPAAASGDSNNAWKNSYINLVNLLVQRGVLTKKDSGSLITQANQAAASSAQNTAQNQNQAPAPASPAAPALVSSDDDTVHVDYVPDTVKAQIRDEVKEDVLKQARQENWAAPNAIPDWVTRYHVTADLRVRYEGDFFPSGSGDPALFHNFNAINTGAPFDTGLLSVAPNSPTYDTDQNRNRFRLRARLGAAIDVGDGFSAGLRLGTGQDDNPVTENQTIGLANNGQGGDFSKYSIWLDRAFLRYEIGGTPDYDLSATIGRFENPFFSSSMIWANDLGFDGLVVQGKYKVADGVTPFLTAGGFPVFNTDLNFSSTSAAKFSSEDKYLFAVQGGTNWQITKDVNFKVAGAMYYFENIQGKVSDPFVPLFPSDGGNTDDSRPSFAQNGNTYIALRNITPVGEPPTATTPGTGNEDGLIDQFQYYGLATPFHEAALTAQLDFSQFDPFHISLQGEFVKNIAFDRSAIENNGPPQQIGPVNNTQTVGDPSSFRGGDTGYNARLILGAPVLTRLWDWNINLTYRYVETVVDGFTDADFGGPLTGTNLKGYIIGGNLGLTSRVWTSVQWMSADAIAGPTYKNDLIQLDINAKF